MAPGHGTALAETSLHFCLLHQSNIAKQQPNRTRHLATAWPVLKLIFIFCLCLLHQSNIAKQQPDRTWNLVQLPMVIQSLRDVFSDNHEIDPANMTPEVKKGIRDQRMNLYKVICYCGVGIMMLTDKAILLNTVYQYNHTAAHICVVYFTIALVSMLLGIVASSFPDSAPFAMAVSWNGTLQVFLFLIAFIHLSVMKIYPEFLHLTLTFVLTSVLFTIYWSFCARDPTVRLVEAAHHE